MFPEPRTRSSPSIPPSPPHHRPIPVTNPRLHTLSRTVATHASTDGPKPVTISQDHRYVNDSSTYFLDFNGVRCGDGVRRSSSALAFVEKKRARGRVETRRLGERGGELRVRTKTEGLFL
ncbi:hypothetical protein KC19_6G129100 [Ceratodon purpureus]|uniref:Uncharacterized protein n=1 Tax=Ceratodon purpureus TaxID=3225 RepID=A0A8T0HFB8_CERPU|nr:hypothetical protein KC19_6G129100 [Ceratodon purpureus]